MKGVFKNKRFDYLLAFILIFLVFLSYKQFLLFCTPSGTEAERMLGYYLFAKKVILQYYSFPHFALGFTEFRYTYGRYITYEFFSFPETPLLTPFLLIYILVDIITAEKISLALHIVIGIIGIFLIGKNLGINKIGTILTAILFSHSVNLVSMYACGHINWKTIFLFPLVFYFYIKSHQNQKFILFSVIINLLILFEGGIHIFIWTNLFIGVFGIFYFFESMVINRLFTMLKFFLFEVLLGSVKIIPMIHFFGGYKPPENVIDIRAGIAPPYTIKEFLKALTTPFWGAEYSNYIGIFVIILFFFALFIGLKLNRPILFTSLFFTLLTVKFNGISLFYLLRKFPIFDTQRIPPRFFVMAIFGFGLLCGLVITHLQQRIKKLGKRRAILFEVFLIIFISYIYLDLNRAFNLFQKKCNPLEISEDPIFFNYIPRIIPNGYCALGFADPNFRVWKLNLKENSYAVFDGLDWKLYRNILKFQIFRNGRFEKIQSQPYNGTVSLPIPKDATILRMKYDSPYFKLGLAISLISSILIFLAYNFFNSFHKNRK